MRTAELRSEEDAVDRYYIGYLQDSLTVIDRAQKHLEMSSAPDASVIRAEVVAHKIKGNAALYDLPELGKVAERLEATLLAKDNQLASLAAVQEFSSAIRHVIATGVMPAPVAKPAPLPAKPVVHPSVAPSDNPSVPSNGETEKSILLVFEDVWFVAFMNSYFGDRAKIHACHSCAEAIAWLSQNTPDVIACESDLPDTPGTAFMRVLRGNRATREIPFVIAFPEGSGFDAISEAIAAGASAIVEDKQDVMRLADQMRDIISSENKSILIIDDDEPVRNLLRNTFERAGYNVETANDGLDALKLLTTLKPDLIILDRLMPRMNGEATLREFQNSATNASIPVIVLTAMVNTGEASKWLMRGASEFIAKPFDPEEVLARARKLLRAEKAS